MGVRECAVGIASQLCRARRTALVYPSSKLLAERNSTISPLTLPLPLCVMDAIVALRTRRSAPSSTRQTTSKLRSWIKQRSSASPPPPSGSSPQSQKESRKNNAELDINSHEAIPYQPKTALFRALNSVHPKWLIGACFLAWVAVFTAWYSAKVSAQNRDYRWILSMDENFVMAKINLEEGRWWTLLTSSFSHSDLSHIALNSVGLLFIGGPAARLIGTARTASLWVVSAVTSALASQYWRQTMPGRDPKVGAHGGSGVICALVSVLACLRPKTTLLVGLIVPMPAWLCLAGLFAWDAHQTMTNSSGRTDTAAHVSGYISGFLYWTLRLRGRGI
ncbi:unnamed protein product [Jaminaea pallidilutea]